MSTYTSIAAPVGSLEPGLHLQPGDHLPGVLGQEPDHIVTPSLNCPPAPVRAEVLSGHQPALVHWSSHTLAAVWLDIACTLNMQGRATHIIT